MTEHRTDVLLQIQKSETTAEHGKDRTLTDLEDRVKGNQHDSETLAGAQHGTSQRTRHS